jgi:uncharacterized protein (DUF362 family)
MTKVSIISGDYNNIDIKRLLELINYIPSKKKILIKPNIAGIKHPNSPTITNPKIIEALVIYLKPFSEEIVIAEGSVAGISTKEAFRSAGYEDLSKKYDLKLIDLNDSQRIEKEWKFGKLKIPKILEDYEYINVAKMKTHIQTTATLAMKNQKGILHPEDKKRFHKSGKLPEMIKELNIILKPDLNIIDAIDCIEGNGPGEEGKVKKINYILASKDAQAIDNVAIKIMDIHLTKVEYLETKDYELIGDPLKTIPFKLPDEHYTKLNLKLWFNNSCSGCNHNIMKSIRELPTHPFKMIKFAYNITLNTTNIIAGPNTKNKPSKGRIICIGSCSKQFAEKNNCIYIEGCPPKTKDIIKKL